VLSKGEHSDNFTFTVTLIVMF